MNKVEKHNRSVNRSNRAFMMLPFLVIGVMLWASGPAQKELQAEQSTYCDMVELHKSSGGENGWPDYKNTYTESCK